MGLVAHNRTGEPVLALRSPVRSMQAICSSLQNDACSIAFRIASHSRICRRAGYRWIASIGRRISMAPKKRSTSASAGWAKRREREPTGMRPSPGRGGLRPPPARSRHIDRCRASLRQDLRSAREKAWHGRRRDGGCGGAQPPRALHAPSSENGAEVRGPARDCAEIPPLCAVSYFCSCTRADPLCQSYRLTM